MLLAVQIAGMAKRRLETAMTRVPSLSQYLMEVHPNVGFSHYLVGILFDQWLTGPRGEQNSSDTNPTQPSPPKVSELFCSP